MIKEAVNHDAAIPTDSRREVLMGYQYALHQQKKQLLQERSGIRKRHESANATSRILREERGKPVTHHTPVEVNAANLIEERQSGKAKRTMRETSTQHSCQLKKSGISCQKHPKQP
jgi:hypothetical protein